MRIERSAFDVDLDDQNVGYRWENSCGIHRALLRMESEDRDTRKHLQEDPTSICHNKEESTAIDVRDARPSNMFNYHFRDGSNLNLRRRTT